jgi:hypothetical protein
MDVQLKVSSCKLQATSDKKEPIGFNLPLEA